MPDATDCRAMCVGADGQVWAAVSDKTKERHDALHVVSWTPGAGAPKDHGLVTIRNPDYTRLWNEEGNPLPHRHGMRKLEDGALTPLYPMGVCAGRDGTAYVTVIMPLTLVAIPGADSMPGTAGLCRSRSRRLSLHDDAGAVGLQRGPRAAPAPAARAALPAGHNAKSALERHQAAYYLWEAALKLLASIAMRSMPLSTNAIPT